VNSSFGQFQADRDVVKLEQTRERSEAYLASYRERMKCERGDFEEYRALISERQKLVSRGGRRGQTRKHRPKDRPGPADDKELKALDDAIASHPVAGCPELGRHIHYAERAVRLEKEIAGIDRRVRRRTGTLARRFELVLEILEQLGYVKDWTLTDPGEVLRRVYNESDLLVVEALERGLLDDLAPAELAAVCSTLVYEPRGPETGVTYELPTSAARTVWVELMRLWRTIKKSEEIRGLDLTREPDPGFAQRVYLWASGSPLHDVLGEDDPAGDFVRVMKQLTDLLRQLEEVAPNEALATKVRAAIDGIQRGVVAYSSVDI
jgi:ATP-dependent RNA helicase HelY